MTQKAHLRRYCQHFKVRRVAITSCATSKFTKDSKQSLLELACMPCVKILKDIKISRKQVDGVIFSSCSTEQYSSAIISEMLGIRPKLSYRLDSLCNSGTNAVASAFSAI